MVVPKIIRFDFFFFFSSHDNNGGLRQLFFSNTKNPIFGLHFRGGWFVGWSEILNFEFFVYVFFSFGGAFIFCFLGIK